MSLRYRIRVETNNNGETKYIPQVGEPKLSVGKYCHVWMEWLDIIRQHAGDVSASKSITYFYDTEEEAHEMVEKYKEKVNQQKQKEVKTVSYINID